MSDLTTTPTPNVPDLPFQIDSNDVSLGGKTTIRDISIPMVYILQSMSPQVQEGPKYIKDAKAGDIYLSVAEKIFPGKEGLTFVPAYFERKYVEWLPRDKGGGFVASYDPDNSAVKSAKPNEKGKLILANGHELTETAYHYIMVLTDGIWMQAIMPLKSTALKFSRRLGSLIQSAVIPGTDKQAPRFLFTYNMKTIRESNELGSWSSPNFERGTVVTEQLYKKSKEFALIAAQGILFVREEEKTEGDSSDDVPF
jgi:hypothetical protein